VTVEKQRRGSLLYRKGKWEETKGQDGDQKIKEGIYAQGSYHVFYQDVARRPNAWKTKGGDLVSTAEEGSTDKERRGREMRWKEIKNTSKLGGLLIDLCLLGKRNAVGTKGKLRPSKKDGKKKNVRQARGKQLEETATKLGGRVAVGRLGEKKRGKGFGGSERGEKTTLQEVGDKTAKRHLRLRGEMRLKCKSN